MSPLTVAATPAGRALLARATPIWVRTHAAVEAMLEPADMERLLAQPRGFSASGEREAAPAA